MKNLKIKSILAIIIFIAVFSGKTKAQEEKSLLWEISGNGLKQHSFLFGTVHLVPQEKYFFTDEMQIAFNKCKTLALEVDMDDISLAQQLSMAKKIMIPDKKTIKDFVSKKDFERLTTYMIDSMKVDKKMFNQIKSLKPIFAVSMILLKLVKDPVTYEVKLMEAAKKKKMDIVGLETIEFQFSTIDKIPVEEQIKSVYLESIGKSPLEEYNKMVDAYVEQDLKKLKELVEEDKTVKDFQKDLLETRNTNWIPVMEKFAKKQSTFFAVGAAHLVGKVGLIQLLRDKGFTVTAVKNMGTFEKIFWMMK